MKKCGKISENRKINGRWSYISPMVPSSFCQMLHLCNYWHHSLQDRDRWKSTGKTNGECLSKVLGHHEPLEQLPWYCFYTPELYLVDEHHSSKRFPSLWIEPAKCCCVRVKTLNIFILAPDTVGYQSTLLVSDTNGWKRPYIKDEAENKNPILRWP